MIRRRVLGAGALLLLGGCAGYLLREPLRVQVADVQSLDGQGMELRFLCLLRVQNPNDTPLDFDGISLDLDLRGTAFASGVSETQGTVPRFGEILVSVPVSASAMGLARVLFGMFGQDRPRLDYRMRGRIGNVRFESTGELTLPSS
ncbi:LEA type 2 family protein [Ramlibacter sp. XY19]|uniref:LEA type 2 family protein n=1 Tax=Ramlibacter paludis TaxID=2908000 RepID=UPI0023DCAE53|nr:LEA type 2 family protein [Ramlibacter paludis]MCG2592902.1 LEA type 2 family protein [Ramlibacter paludis]